MFSTSSVPCVAAASTELSIPRLSRVAVHMPHLEAPKEELFGQHHSEDVCPAQGSSAGALEPLGLFAWAGRLRSRSYWELLVPMFSSS